MKIEDETLLLLGAVAVIVAGAVYAARKTAGAVGGAAASLGNAINPLNDNNVFASAVNSVGGSLAGTNGRNADGSWTLGGWIYDVTHPATAAAVANITAPVQPDSNALPFVFNPAKDSQAAYDSAASNDVLAGIQPTTYWGGFNDIANSF